MEVTQEILSNIGQRRNRCPIEIANILSELTSCEIERPRATSLRK